MYFFENRNDHGVGSSSRQELDPSGFHQAQSEDMVCLREELSIAREELASLKANMSTIVENQVTVRVNRQLPILMRKIDYWIAGGRQGPSPTYVPTPVELAPNKAPVVLDPYIPEPVKDLGVSMKKKARKRKKKTDYSGTIESRSGPSVMHDAIYKHERKYHVLGEPILPLEALHNEFGDMRSLHDIIRELRIVISEWKLRHTRFSSPRCQWAWALSITSQRM